MYIEQIGSTIHKFVIDRVQRMFAMFAVSTVRVHARAGPMKCNFYVFINLTQTLLPFKAPSSPSAPSPCQDRSEASLTIHFPGIFFVLPCIETYQKVDLRTITLGVPPQEVSTRYSEDVSLSKIGMQIIFCSRC